MFILALFPLYSFLMESMNPVIKPLHVSRYVICNCFSRWPSALPSGGLWLLRWRPWSSQGDQLPQSQVSFSLLFIIFFKGAPRNNGVLYNFINRSSPPLLLLLPPALPRPFSNHLIIHAIIISLYGINHVLFSVIPRRSPRGGKCYYYFKRLAPFSIILEGPHLFSCTQLTSFAPRS